MLGESNWRPYQPGRRLTTGMFLVSMKLMAFSSERHSRAKSLFFESSLGLLIVAQFGG
jgi:hypothetical protein